MPYAKYMPKDLQKKLYSLIERGANVIFCGGAPLNAEFEFNHTPCSKISEYFLERGYFDIRIAGGEEVRHIHFKNTDSDVYMFSKAGEVYLQNHLERGFDTLDFYRAIL